MILPNTSEPLVFRARNSVGEPVTGLSITVKIFNPTNGQIWDWATSAFSATPSQPTATMTEISAVNLPGYYYRSWPGAAAGYYLAEYSPPAGETADDYPAPAELRVSSYALTGDAMTMTSGERNAIADAVWDEALSGHATAGTAGAALVLVDVAVSTRATAAAVWATVTPNASWTYGESVEIARKVVTNRLDATATGGGTLILYDDNGTTALVTQTLRGGSGENIVNVTGSPALRGAAS